MAVPVCQVLLTGRLLYTLAVAVAHRGPIVVAVAAVAVAGQGVLAQALTAAHLAQVIVVAGVVPLVLAIWRATAALASSSFATQFKE